jgi:hypothetical protein
MFISFVATSAHQVQRGMQKFQGEHLFSKETYMQYMVSDSGEQSNIPCKGANLKSESSARTATQNSYKLHAS